MRQRRVDPLRALVLALQCIACATGLLTVLPAAAQVAGTDCGCALTGTYVDPDPGVRIGRANATTGLSPGGRHRVVVTSLPGQTPVTLDVVRVAGNVTLLHAEGIDWGFSPDDDRFVIGSATTGPTGTQLEYRLYDLAAGNPAPLVWSNGPTPWSSARIRFSDDGGVFLFAGHDATVGTSLTLVDVASRTRFETSFMASTPPADLDDDADPAVASWGFGPDPTRFVYAYVLNSANGNVQWGRVNLLPTPQLHEDDSTANSQYAKFSPCGDAIGFVVKQLATSDLTDVYLYSTRDPLAAQLGSQQLPFPDLEVQSSAQDHEVLQGGDTTFLADNRAGDACPTNAPPTADFDAPPGLVAGAPGDFTDASTDSDGQVVAWSWEFGDGATSSAQNPSHAYVAPGSYTVRLTVTDDDGATDSVEQDVSVCGSIATLAGRILYEDAAEGSLSILNADDGSTVRLTNHDEGYSEIRGGRFSPDGSQIVYADQGISLAGIWTMRSDGSQRRRLTDGDGGTLDFDFHEVPAWSPDARWIVFVSNDVEVAGAQGIWMVRADGTGLAKIPGTTHWDSQPSFAPAIGCSGVPAAERGPGCYTIAFTHLDEITRVSTIAETRGDGSGATTVPSPPGSFSFLQLSKDGSAYVYSRFLGLTGPLGGRHRIYTAERPFANPVEITSGGDDVFWYPTFSPDGDAVAYSFSVNGTPGSANDLEIGVTDAMGCSSRRLLSGPFQQRVLDWAPGHATQAPGSIAGHVGLARSVLRTSVPFAVVELVGDYAATVTADANGDFVFEDVPIGANVAVRFVSAPGHVAFPDAVEPSFTNFTGHSAGFYVYADLATATIGGTVQTTSFERVADVTLTAVGEGETLVATTDGAGVYSLQIQNFGDYTLTPSKPGWRFEPPSIVGTLSNGTFYFTAIRLPPPGLVAFVSSRTGDEDVWLADAEGANATNLTESRGGAQRDPAWSPDGRRLVYASDERGLGFELWTYDLDSDEYTSLETWGREPAWSPDGAQIVYATDGGLVLRTLATSTSDALTDDGSDASPAWRPDGSAIAFERELGGESELFEMAPTPAASAFPITAYAGDDRDPAFAALGGGFAFSTQNGDTTAAPLVRAEWPLVAYLVAAAENPTWSQDGTQLAYESGGAIHRQDPVSGVFGVISESGSDRDPAWQPNGRGACANGEDDDFDGFVDLADSGCADLADASEQTDAPGCDNGLDDDGDGLADMEDPGCPFPVQPYEDPVCDNGLDDDGDGATDFADSICQASWPYWEEAPSCGLGAELALLLGLVRRRIRAATSARKFTSGV